MTHEELREAICELQANLAAALTRAAAAELALGAYLCQECRACLSPQEIDHILCHQCAENDMAKRLGAGLLVLPDDWYGSTPDRGSQL